MEQNYFSGVVKDICRGVSGKQKRAEIEEELIGHLEDTFERNKAIGKSDEEAEKAAVEALGNLDVLRERLGAVHSFSHAKAMSASLWIFIISFILMKFNILDSFGFGEIRIFIAGALAVLAFVRLRTANKKLNIAFFAHAASFILMACYKCVKIVVMSDAVIRYPFIILSAILDTAFWFFSFAGLRELHAKFCPDDEKKPHLALPMVLLPLGSAGGAVILLLNRGEDINFEAFILPIIIALFYIFTAFQLFRLNNKLWDADAEYGISPWNKTTVPTAAAIIALCIVCPMSFMYAKAVEKPKMSELVVHDTEKAAEADEVRKYIREELEFACEPSCELPEGDFLDELPDSEIMRYKDADYLAWSAICADDYTCHFYDFYLYDEETNGLRARTLIRLSFSDESDIKPYKNGVYYTYTPGWWPFIPLADPEVFASVQVRRNEKIYAQNPEIRDFYETHNTYYYEDRKATGIEFAGDKNTVVYFAVSNGIGDPHSIRNMNHELFYVKQELPFAFSEVTMRDYAKTVIDTELSGGFFSDIKDLSFSNQRMPSPLMYNPEYLGLYDSSEDGF